MSEILDFKVNVWLCGAAWIGCVMPGGPDISSQEKTPQAALRSLADQLDAAGGIEKTPRKPEKKSIPTIEPLLNTRLLI